MAREEAIKNILESLGNITREFNVRGNYPFKQFALGRPHIDILFLLSQNSPLNIKDLSIKLNVTSGAVTQFIDALEDMSLVEKTNNPDDKRSRLVYLTDTAVRELNKFQTEYIKIVGGVFGELTPKELIQLDQLLMKVRTK